MRLLRLALVCAVLAFTQARREPLALVVNAKRCNAPKALCKGSCLVLNTAQNCGACGRVCRPGELCTGSPKRCKCGALATSCLATQNCVAGKCVTVAPANASPRPSPRPSPSPSPRPAPTPTPSPSPSSAPTGGALYLLGIPGRYQYDANSGYCGEVSIQTLMLRHGAWIPQEAARAAGGGELLPGVNYAQALANLRVSYEAWTGSGYQAFFAWAKAKLKSGLPVISVVFYTGGRDNAYDHVEPIVGVRSWSSSALYEAGDVFYVHSNYGTVANQRAASGFWCTAAAKNSSITIGGCVPSATRWGYAVKGAAYAGIGPATSLAVGSASEPGVGRSVAMTGTLTIRGLTPGLTYKLHMVTNTTAVPAAANKAALASVPALATWKAAAATETRAVTFQSNTPAYFITVAA